jgi:hypothetical protein
MTVQVFEVGEIVLEQLAVMGEHRHQSDLMLGLSIFIEGS